MPFLTGDIDPQQVVPFQFRGASWRSGDLSPSVDRGLVALIAPAASAAPAVLIPVHDVVQLPSETALPECLDDTVGQQMGTETLDGRLVVTDRTFHFSGTDTLVYTVRFTSGSVVTGRSVEHLSFNSVAGGQTTQSTVIKERRTVFDGAGQDVGTVMIHALSHVS